MNNHKHSSEKSRDNNSCHNTNQNKNVFLHKEHNAIMSHGSAKDFLQRFWIVTFLLIPLVFTNEFVTEFIGINVLPFSRWVGFVIATIIFGFSLVFFKHARHEIKSRKYGMMTLVSIAVGSGYLFSVASTFITLLQVEFYLEISTLIWVLLFGHYLEARSSSSAGDALQEVAKLLPKKAHKLKNGIIEEEVDIVNLIKGDIVLVKPGEKIPADGIIEKGSSNIDEAIISGESKPIRKKNGDKVIAGSICFDGSLTIKLSRVGENSTIGQIQKLIAEARNTKPYSQKIADKASAILVFVALITSLLTILIWTIILGGSFVFAITLAITVLVIACPHALGLAIPTVTTITTTLAIKNGLFIKNLAKIETIRKADYVVFDKTGTLTNGVFGVTDVVSFKNINKKEVTRITASIEKHSSHIIGQSIVRHAINQKIEQVEIDNFQNISGKGISANISGKKYFVGNKAFIEDSKVFFENEIIKTAEEFARKGNTIVFLADKSRILGIISLADKIKKESYKAVKDLHNLGIKVAMLTGDNKKVANGVAKELNIDTYFAEVLPKDKYKHIKELQEKGNIVLMVGDGVNDAPALTQADAGIAIGTGTDVAVEAGDVVLMRNNPEDIVRLLILSRKVYRKMIQNLIWALGYNTIAIPSAAGAFSAFGFFLRPEIGAILMSLSTVIVVINALTLKKANLESTQI
ncbi:MAG: P-type ATPase (P-ATPase) superfamily cation transporter [Parcubacteria group bacterium GW2011_GWA2_31_28]|nr:MAG: P-type ATPase (P-ATPase) superfamily cation transporter [Parcubacteria group bacterium GW2011_GWA2_31_28]